MASRGSAVLLAIAALLVAGCAGSVVEPADVPLFSPGALPGEAVYRTDDTISHVLVPGPYAPRAPEFVELASAVDGGRIEIGIVRPHVPDGVRVPIIVEASPYYFETMNAEGMRDDFTWRFYVDDFVRHGYAFAILPVRGSADQGGCSDLAGPSERADLDQAITFLGTQDWSNGNVGLHGLSYRGSTAWALASMGNPHVKTIVPLAGVNSLWDLMYRNGSHEVRGSARMVASYQIGYGVQQYNPLFGNRGAVETAQLVVCPEVMRGYAASVAATLTRGDDPLGFFAERDLRPGVEQNYNGSVFVVQGLQDWNVDPGHTYPWINTLEERGIVVKHLLGQWEHNMPYSAQLEEGTRRWDYSETLLRWFDRWLKNDTSVSVGPRVEVQDDAGQWRTEEAWPPRDATPFRLYLAPDGKLATQPASGSERVPIGPAPHKLGESPFSDRRMWDPLCAACALFTGEPLESEIRIAGLPPVALTVVPTTSFGHVAAWLYAIEGEERRVVGWGAIDLSYAAGDGTKRDVAPGQPLVARLQLEPLDAVVPAGARLALLLHQGGYGDHTASIPTAPVQVEVGGEASLIELPRITRDGTTFFAPPSAE